MSKKVFKNVLDRLLSEDENGAKKIFQKYVTEKAAAIDRKILEADNDPVYVIDQDEDSVSITKCDNQETANLFVKIANDQLEDGEEAELSVAFKLPETVKDAVNSLESLTADDIEDSDDVITDTEEFTVTVSSEEFEGNTEEEKDITEDDEESIDEDSEYVEDCLVVTVYEDSIKKVSRILQAHANEVSISDNDDDTSVFVAIFDDADIMDSVADRLDDVDGVIEIEYADSAELDLEYDDETEEDDEDDLRNQLLSLSDKYTTLNSKEDKVDDIDELDEAYEMSKVKDPALNGSQGIGSDKTKIDINNKSPLIQNNKTEAEPVEIISQNAKGYNREPSPTVATKNIAKNQRKNAFTDYKNVSKEGDSKAELNSDKGFGKKNDRSPVIAAKSYKK